MIFFDKTYGVMRCCKTIFTCKQSHQLKATELDFSNNTIKIWIIFTAL